MKNIKIASKVKFILFMLALGVTSFVVSCTQKDSKDIEPVNEYITYSIPKNSFYNDPLYATAQKESFSDETPQVITWADLGKIHNDLIKEWKSNNINNLTLVTLKEHLLAKLLLDSDAEKASIDIVKTGQEDLNYYKQMARDGISILLYEKLNEVEASVVYIWNTTHNLANMKTQIEYYKNNIPYSLSFQEKNIFIGFLSILEYSTQLWANPEVGGDGGYYPIISYKTWQERFAKCFLSDCWGMVCGACTCPTPVGALAGGACASGSYLIGEL